MSMKKFTGVLITGGARGIGFELAKMAAADCETIILVNMDESVLLQAGRELQQKFGVDVIVITKDLGTITAAEELYMDLKKKNIQVDVLMNNAGIGAFGEFQHMPWEKCSLILQVNIITLTHLTKLFLHEMIERRKGFILNVASMAAFQPGPLMSIYYASKAYVLSFSRSIARELTGTGVSVTALCPGPTRTNFQKRVGSENSLLSRFNWLQSAEDVAEYGYKSMLKKKIVAIPGIFNSLIVFITRFIPMNLLTTIVYKLQRLNRKSSAQGEDERINEHPHKTAA